MKVFKYQDYNHYLEVQIEANKAKFHCQWVGHETIEEIYRLVRAKKILCHGVRNGGEMFVFDALYEPEHIVGTDIAPTVNKLEEKFEVYQHDFHDRLIDYVDYFDLVYTNSFDHSYAPRVALSTFNEQLVVGGHLAIELMVGDNNGSCEMDPLEISIEEYKELLKEIDHVVTSEFDTEYVHGRGHVIVSKKC